MDTDNAEVPNGMESVEETVSSGNPSWQELYDVLPDGFQSLIEPTLSKWDKGTQAKFQAHAEAQLAYEPYKQFLDNEIGSAQIEQALSVAQLIDTDPKEFMKQMQAYYGDSVSQDQVKPPVVEDNDDDDGFSKPFDLTSDPNFKTMKEQQDTIAAFLAKQVEAEESAKADSQLETKLAELTEKYGEFDEDYVFGVAVNLSDDKNAIETAVQRYHAMVEGIRTKPSADSGLPNILTPGGGLPSEGINPAEMDKKQRMAYMVNALTNANKT